LIPPEGFTAPRVSSTQKADGSMVSKPLEDLWPFLDREEFRDNMIVPPLEE
jgi:acetolactate synthase-1/2/3 large subunit